jgi:hypothetical protein
MVNFGLSSWLKSRQKKERCAFKPMLKSQGFLTIVSITDYKRFF